MTVANGQAPTGYIPIDDGYTEIGYIAASKSHQAIRFRYRPITQIDKGRVFGKLQRLWGQGDQDGDTRAEIIVAQTIADHIKEWDFRKPDGTEVPIREEELFRSTKSRLTKRLFGIVMDDEDSDPDPEEDRQDRHQKDDDRMQAALASVGVQESQEKN